MFTFVSGNRALDFAGTVQERDAGFVDLLTTPAALGEWLVAAELLDRAPECGARDLARAVDLREAVYRLAVGTVRGQAWHEADRELINRVADGPQPVIALRADGGVDRRGDCDHALARIAATAVELLGGSDRDRIKQCGRDACTRLYLDTSRAGSRRWCDMTLCGNRAKSATFRARHGER
ncbi:CGNR zinc finger domain-containing protein [Nocardia spumae]|uniref:CGNR zinc finger domain-containing protein n=1 Tax=Nocardia spumae TaxID=2887190 RepID=UPI001D1368AE|nr:ABATE domain-containing protein [Nocardia spumae]